LPSKHELDPTHTIHRVTIGGANPGEGNIISGHVESPVNLITGAIWANSYLSPHSQLSDFTIKGNCFGTQADCVTHIGPGTNDGISISAKNVVIGGTGTYEHNVFAGGRTANPLNGAPGVALGLGDENPVPSSGDTYLYTISGNYFGVGMDGVTQIKEAGTGVPVQNQVNLFVVIQEVDPVHVVIGGSTPAEGNIIKHATLAGIFGFRQE
jgi:hypothetical protein